MSVFAVLVCATSAMFWIERFFPARSWPLPPSWWARSIIINGIYIAMVLFAGKLWGPWFKAHRLWSLESLGLAGGIAAGILCMTFTAYWWHRLKHTSKFMWRGLHQMHHSAKRIEIMSTHYRHPLEMVAGSLLASTVYYLILGLTPEMAAYSSMITALMQTFGHWNVRTPQWIGYFVQRPEGHCVHHQRYAHNYNYSPLSMWDIVFGTFRNPKRWDGKCGFADNRETKVWRMLKFDDVNAPSKAA